MTEEKKGIMKYKKTIISLAAAAGVVVGGSGGGYVGSELTTEKYTAAVSMNADLLHAKNDLTDQVDQLTETIQQYHQSQRLLEQKMANMRKMTTDEIIQRDAQNVIIAYGLVKILDVWAKSRDAKERAGLEKMMNIRFDMKDDQISILPALPPVATVPAQ